MRPAVVLCPYAQVSLDPHGPPITLTAARQSLHTAGIESHKGPNDGNETTAIKAAAMRPSPRFRRVCLPFSALLPAPAHPRSQAEGPQGTFSDVAHREAYFLGVGPCFASSSIETSRDQISDTCGAMHHASPRDDVIAGRRAKEGGRPETIRKRETHPVGA
ncbi:hypothetical protein JCM21900_002684 [Sporobolomyces salmonicolor]